LNAPVEAITQGLFRWVMLGSVLLYLASRQFGWNLPSYPSGVWFNRRHTRSGLVPEFWKPLIKCSQQSLEVFAVGIDCSSGFVNIRAPQQHADDTAGTATRFISQMAYSDWRVILAEFGACQTRSSPLERCGSWVPQASSCSAATITALIP
jgi:hypothetical protein